MGSSHGNGIHWLHVFSLVFYVLEVFRCCNGSQWLNRSVEIDCDKFLIATDPHSLSALINSSIANGVEQVQFVLVVFELLTSFTRFALVIRSDCYLCTLILIVVVTTTSC